MLSIKQKPLLISRLHVIVFVVFAGLLLSSCSYRQNQLLFEQTNTLADTVYQQIRANIDNYCISPQDILQIKNIQQSKNLVDLSAGNSGGTAQESSAQEGENYEVDDDGTIALTGIGRVQIAGLTRTEARKKIENIYNEKFLNDALFDVKIINLKVTVFGEVKAPGNYSLTKDRTKLVDILGQAGGLTDRGNEKNIKIIRGDVNSPDITVIDLSKVNSIFDQRTVLTNNDVIYVSQNKTAVRAQNVQNFSIIAQPILLLVNTALIIVTLATR